MSWVYLIVWAVLLVAPLLTLHWVSGTVDRRFDAHVDEALRVGGRQ